MWTILTFDAVAALYVGMAIAGLIDLRWVRRLPSLEELTGAGRELRKPIRRSSIIAAREHSR